MANLPVPNPRTAVAGEFETAAFMNMFRDAVNFLIKPPIAVLYQTTTQSIANNTVTALAFDNTLADTYGGHSNTTNNTRYTAVVPGWYWVKGSVAWAANSTGNRALQIYKNGVAWMYDWDASLAAGSFNASGNAVTSLVQLAVGDYVEIQVQQGSGANLSTVASSGVTSTLQVDFRSA